VNRRELFALLGTTAVAWPRAGWTQQKVKIARVGWLGPSLDNPVQAVGRQVLLSGLAKLGFTEGQNLVGIGKNRFRNSVADVMRLPAVTPSPLSK
jgi:hypothetical protein